MTWNTYMELMSPVKVMSPVKKYIKLKRIQALLGMIILLICWLQIQNHHYNNTNLEESEFDTAFEIRIL